MGRWPKSRWSSPGTHNPIRDSYPLLLPEQNANERTCLFNGTVQCPSGFTTNSQKILPIDSSESTGHVENASVANHVFFIGGIDSAGNSMTRCQTGGQFPPWLVRKETTSCVRSRDGADRKNAVKCFIRNSSWEGLEENNEKLYRNRNRTDSLRN